jgi:PAS domain S-box-containing protein
LKSLNNQLWILVGIFWTIVIGSFALHESSSNYDMVFEYAEVEARANYDKQLVYRKWAANHGGVYVPVTEQTPPNTYLKNIAERDVETLSGRHLTLINPAYMIRQVHELEEEQHGVKGHITSLKPLRPENKPDAWETKALQSFEQGKTSAQTISEINGDAYLNIMFPILVESECLKCHEEQGYKLGDIRGGMRVSVPLERYLEPFRSTLPKQVFYHFGVWLLGVFGLLFFRTKIHNQFTTIAASLKKITEGEKSLKESQKRYKSLVENSNDLITRFDNEGHLLYVNYSSNKYWGLTPEECVGRLVYDFICPEDREQMKRQFHSWTTAKGSYASFENRQLHTSGKTTIMQWMIASLRDEQGEVIEYNGTGRDISKWVEAEKKMVDRNNEIVKTWTALRIQIKEYETNQKLLKESEERFSALHDASFGGIVIHDKGIVLDCNQKVSDLTGFTHEELVGMDATKIVTQDSRELVIRNIESGYEHQYEVEGIRKDGSVYPVSVIGKNIQYRGHEVRVAEFRDITKHKQAEEKTRNIALFLEENPFPVLRVDGGGVLHYANRAAADLLSQWQCGVGGMVPEFAIQELSTALKSGLNRELEALCGSQEFSFILVPIIERDYVNFYGRDVTKRKRIEAALVQSKELLKRAQEIAHLGSWDLNLADNSLTWSDEAYRIFGFQPQELGASYELFLEAVHPDDRGAVDEAYSGSVREGRDSYEIEHRIIQKSSGEIRYVHEKCQHSRDENGMIIHSMGMVHDITERKRREKEIDRLNADLEARAGELEDANRELEAFNFTVAHDLCKPLTVINGYSEVLIELCDNLDEQALGYLREIQDGTLRMSQLIEALLDFSRLSHAEICRDRVDLSALAQTAAAELKLADPERRVTIRIEEGMVVNGDASLLRVVMNNLAGNAWKYTDIRDEAIIEIGTTLIDGIMTCFVRDNGTGFDLADAGTLFTPFKRLKGTEDTRGFGIGLATVERIISRHGGRVWAEGEPSKGATFYFTLGA